MSNFTVKETKGRTHFSTGAQRSDDTGKPKWWKERGFTK